MAELPKSNKAVRQGEGGSRAKGKRADHPRRKEVLRIAAKLFATKGFHGTSMDDIADGIGILKGSLYYWIDSKEDLLREIVLDGIETTSQKVQEVVGQELPLVVKLRKLIHIYVDAWVERPDNLNVFLTEYKWLDPESLTQYIQRREVIPEIFRRLLTEGVNSGDFELPEGEVSIAINSIFGILGWFPRWYNPGGWATPEQLADVLSDFILRAIGCRDTSWTFVSGRDLTGSVRVADGSVDGYAQHN